MGKTKYLRNDPTATFDAHLYRREEIEDAGGGGDGEETDRPVSSLCSRRSSYGPFYAVTIAEIREELPDDEGSICSVCVRVVEHE